MGMSENLAELYKSRKWYNLINILTINLENKQNLEETKKYTELLFKRMLDLHPEKLTDLILLYSKTLENPIDFLRNSIKTLKNAKINLDSFNRNINRISVQIAIEKQKNGESVEEDVYKWKNCNIKSYNNLALKYYENNKHW